MTIEGAIADLQNLIDNDEIPFWAKPSLRKIKETVEMEREQRINEQKDLSLKPIKLIKNGNNGYFEAYYDPAREIIFLEWMTAEIARSLGLTIKEEDEEEIGKDILTAMKESAEAVKNSPHYDFSCVTSLFREEGTENE